MGTRPPETTSILSGWKDIAAYLGVDKTTAQRWAKVRALPVRYLPGPRGKVVADPAELDGWRKAGPAIAPAQEPPASSPPRRRAALGILAAVVLLAVIGSIMWRRRPSAPARYELRGSQFAVFDAGGRPRWEYVFPSPLIPDAPTDIQRHFWTGDLDGDGHPEVLFAPQAVDRVQLGSALYCFSDSGKLKWRFVPGKDVEDQRKHFLNSYWISQLIVIPKSPQGGPWIVTTSNHAADYPDQVAVLDPQGRLLGDYWHAGHVLHLATADIDGDGVPEILLGGVNNGYEQATLVALDPRHVWGASRVPAGDHREFRGIPTGAEKAVVLFPRSCITRETQEFNRAFSVVVKDGMILVYVVESITERGSAYIIYQFDRRLNLVSVDPSDAFISEHKVLQLEGLLHHAFSDSEAAALRDVSVRWPSK